MGRPLFCEARDPGRELLLELGRDVFAAELGRDVFGSGDFIPLF